MHVTVSDELDAVLDVVFLSDADKATLKQYVGALSVGFTSLYKWQDYTSLHSSVVTILPPLLSRRNILKPITCCE